MYEAVHALAPMHFQNPMDYPYLMHCLHDLTQRYDFLTVSTLGYSLWGKPIPLLQLGDRKSERHILYVGTHHGMEWITAALLLTFLRELCAAYQKNLRVYHIHIRRLLQTRTIYIVPMLNPDGVELQLHGCDSLPMQQQLLALNGNSPDFTHWQANGRGVDLNHNYDAGAEEYRLLEQSAGITAGPTRYSGTAPESEPETRALAEWVRGNPHLRLALTLHTQGEEIYYTSGGICPPQSEAIVSLFASMSGYTPEIAQGMAAYGGFTDWLIRRYNIPAFTLECGKGTNPLPIQDHAGIYRKIREILFTAPILESCTQHNKSANCTSACCVREIASPGDAIS